MIVRQLIVSTGGFFRSPSLLAVVRGIVQKGCHSPGHKSDLLFQCLKVYWDLPKGRDGVYIDVVIILNFLVDLLLIIATCRLCGYPINYKRSTLSALVGGLYGGLCILPGLALMGGTVGRMLCLSLMSGIAFGFQRSTVRSALIFVLLTMALGGLALGIGSRSFISVVLSAAVLTVLCVVAFRGKIGTEYIPIVIRHKTAVVRFLALRDTGNTLIDPISGQQVLIVSAQIGKQLLDLTAAQLRDPVTSIGQIVGTRLIPYYSVGRENGMLLARKFEDVTIGSRRGSYVVAFAPHEIGAGEPYDALMGG